MCKAAKAGGQIWPPAPVAFCVVGSGIVTELPQALPHHSQIHSFEFLRHAKAAPLDFTPRLTARP